MTHTPLKVFIIGYVWPELQSSAAGLRSWNLIQSFQEAGWSVAFACAAKKNSFTAILEEKGVQTIPIELNHSSFDIIVKNFNPNFVVFDRFITEEQFGWRIQEHCPKAIRILDTQDLHFLRRTREKAIKAQSNSLFEFEPFHLCSPPSEDVLREISSIYRCDATLVLSSFEFQLLTETFKIPQNFIHLSRFHYPRPPDSPGFHERENFIFIGNFRHPPNLDGIQWLRRSIWPVIYQKLPKAQVFIYGAYPPKIMMKLTEPNIGFHVEGFTPDQFQVLKKHRVNLAPLRFGAGIKGKITDGWWAGLPVITTPIGAEGMADELPWGGDISTEAQDFAEKAVQLYTDELQWRDAQSRGFEILRSFYDHSVNSKALILYLLKLKDQLEERRKSNLIGSILNFHTHRSTKYFSQWIEEKSKRLKMLSLPAQF